tara:strand:- start:547 stop:1008 length:462 start_codon:yes stop_codon:yes gene_type:complete
MKNSKKIITYIFLLLLFLPESNADTSSNFLSLKNTEVNLRQGPSFEHPIKFIYKKKYLPVIILDNSETWRKIMDFENNSGWIHISQLSKRKTGINKKENSIIYKRPTIFSKPLAKLERGRLLLISKCKKKWCKTKTGNFTGWTLKKNIWGKTN